MVIGCGAGVGAAVEVGVGAAVEVGVGAAVEVGVGAAVEVGVGVCVGVMVDVCVGVGPGGLQPTTTAHASQTNKMQPSFCVMVTSDA